MALQTLLHLPDFPGPKAPKRPQKDVSLMREEIFPYKQEQSKAEDLTPTGCGSCHFWSPGFSNTSPFVEYFRSLEFFF